MPLTLHAATVPSYLQIMGAMAHLIDKAESFCQTQGLASEDLIQARLAPDMLPFAYQVKSTGVHSIGAIEGVRSGVFSPDTTPPPDSFAGLRERVSETIAKLAAIDAAEMEGFFGRDVQFRFGEFTMDFTAENFLLSFSQPNFYFHATTAYDILRMKGVPIGKRDFAGGARITPPSVVS